MELDDTELSDCVDDIVAILEDDKELKHRTETKQSVVKLNELKDKNFIITTHGEVEVCRDAMMSIKKRSEELQEWIKDTKADIDQKKQDICKAVDDKTQKALDDALQQLEQNNDSQFRAMKQAIEKLNDRLKHVEAESSATKIEITLIKERLTEIESSVERLEVARNECEKLLKYAEQKEDLRHNLVELYEESYIKTWISPLQRKENTIGINEVYVTPHLVVKQKHAKASENTENHVHCRHESPTGVNMQDNLSSLKPKECDVKTIFRYKDIFQTDGRTIKKIFIIGDVGTGKSSLSKMMMFNWCKSVRCESMGPGTIRHNSRRIRPNGNAGMQFNDEESDIANKGYADGNMVKAGSSEDTSCQIANNHWLHESECNESEQAIQGANKTNQLPDTGIENIAEMHKFEFLFSIPLHKASGHCSDIKEMIQILYKNLISKELLERILNDGSERCLVVADGLDEWSSPRDALIPLHVSHGLPIRDGIKDATLVFLSRPSAKGVLNLKSTECDRQIEFLGVSEKSVSYFVSTYLGKLNKLTWFKDFKAKISYVKIEHLEKNPLILQQLIWMYCERKEIGSSTCDIYSNIVNIMFAWSERASDEGTAEYVTSSTVDLDYMQPPPLLQRFPRCEENQRIIILLGNASFQALTEDVTSNEFGRLKLRRCGFTNDDIANVINSGILVESSNIDQTLERTVLSFIHTSYLEFFAAVYIASHNPNKNRVSHTQENTILEGLFMKLSSIEDILQLSNVLKMVCRMCPCLLEKISELISRKTMNETSIVRYRKDLSNWSTCSSRVSQLQKFLYDCYLECGTLDHPVVSLCDVIVSSPVENYSLNEYGNFLNQDISVPCTEMIIPESVLSIYLASLYWLSAKTVILDWISNLPQLQFIRVEYFESCEALDKLTLTLSHYTTLKRVFLRNITCDRGDCEGHVIDLSKNYQLESINITNCSCIMDSVGAGVNATKLE